MRLGGRTGRVLLGLTLFASATGAIEGNGRAAGVRPVTMTLASQTPWLGPGQEFQLRVLMTPDPGSAGQLSVSVFSAVANRTEFTRSLDNRITNESVLTRPFTVALSDLTPDPAGARTIRIPVQDPTQRRDPSRISLSGDGVYPVRVVFRPDDGSPQAILVTHIVYFAGRVTSPKLNVTWIVPIHVPPQPNASGGDGLTQAQSDGLAQLAEALDAHGTVPVVVAPTPDTLNVLATSGREQDRATLALLAHPRFDRQVVASTYVRVSLPGLIGAGLISDATLQLTRGSDALGSTLNLRPDGRTWVESGPINEASAAFLRGVQVDRLIVPDDALSPNPLNKTLAQPFELVVRPDLRIRAAAADPALERHFVGSDPILAAHQLLADLATIYRDAPNQTRGVVIDTPPSWKPNASFLRVFLDGLASSPVLSAATLDSFFANVAPATISRGVPMTRRLIPDGRVQRDVATLPVEAERAARRRVAGFTSSLNEDNPLTAVLDNLLLVAESSDLLEPADRQAPLNIVNQRIKDQLAQVQLPSARTITLTARTGRLPVTILYNADYPLHVVLRLQSDKLSFPNSSGSTAYQSLDLHRGNNPVLLTVRARTPASFPLHISLVSRDGQLVLSSTTFTVQSTALSGVGLLLTVGAALFLIIWWSRQILRSRAGKRSVPDENPPSPSGSEPPEPPESRKGLHAIPARDRIRRLDPVPGDGMLGTDGQ